MSFFTHLFNLKSVTNFSLLPCLLNILFLKLPMLLYEYIKMCANIFYVYLFLTSAKCALPTFSVSLP